MSPAKPIPAVSFQAACCSVTDIWIFLYQKISHFLILRSLKGRVLILSFSYVQNLGDF
jgi:hypothetical protein